MRENLSSCKSSIQLNAAAALGFSLSLICGPMDMHFHVELYTGLFYRQHYYCHPLTWILSRKMEIGIPKPQSYDDLQNVCTQKAWVCTLAVKSFVLHQRKKTWVVNFLIESSSKKTHRGKNNWFLPLYGRRVMLRLLCVWKVQDSLSNVCFFAWWEEPAMMLKKHFMLVEILLLRHHEAIL